MTILALQKVTLCGLLSEKPAVLDELQEFGCVHLVSLRESETKDAGTGRAEHVTEALRFLLTTPLRRRQVQADEGFDLEEIVGHVLENKRRRRQVEDERDFLLRRIENLEPWGDFRFPPRDALAGQRLWFYRMPLRWLSRLPEIDLPWQVIHRDSQEAFVVIISEGQPPADAMPAPRIRIGSVPLSGLEERLERAEIELEDLDAERQSLTRWIYLINKNLAAAADRASLTIATEQTRDESPVFVVQGWLPKRESERLEAFALERRLALLVEAPGPDEIPPTLLDNPEAMAGGQDMVGFYQTPGFRSWDPSIVVFFSFAAFFAMILADAGYALLLGCVLAYFWRRLGRTQGGRRARSMAASILFASLIYGVIVGSYFGVTPPTGGLLSGLVVLDLSDFDTMMPVTVVIGCAHIALAAALRAINAPTAAKAAPQLGWIAVLAGALLIYLGSPDLLGIGLAIVAVSLLTVIAFSSDRPVRGPKDAVLRFVGGLPALMNVSSLFGDVLSYLRLFALGLASSSLAVTFNDMAVGVREAVPGIGLLFSLVILLFGHGINLTLGIVSGFVHGLRLNFIEFFRWGISEEGYPFRPFAKKEIQQ